MLAVLKRNAEEVAIHAAQLIAGAIRKNPALRLGMATGNTMVGVYSELVRMHREQGLDFSRVITFNLDEYLGIGASHPGSLRHFMDEHFFTKVNLAGEHIHAPDGTIGGDYEEYCTSYEQAIRDAGGIDLQLLGIGRNGHIGFNEPTSSLGSRTRLKVLDQPTVADNYKSFGTTEDVPKCAITVGIGTILECRKILLLANGESKADAILKAIEGPVTSAVPASALQMHPDVTFLLDEGAASKLTHKEYYRRVMEMTELLTPERLS
ncbi:MAG TPA: glucosamine-6-phosphate deaminase [Candidatus Acidoferrales bacterium]|nr:glucosamine-6-phosphate deaminase [Candidatus Acidoferrales bacterium]